MKPLGATGSAGAQAISGCVLFGKDKRVNASETNSGQGGGALNACAK